MGPVGSLRCWGWAFALALLAQAPLPAAGQSAAGPARLQPPELALAPGAIHGAAAEAVATDAPAVLAALGPDLARTALVLYSHGGSRDSDPDPAECRAEPRPLPAVLTALDGSAIGGLTLRVIGYCYHAVGAIATPGAALSRRERRAREVRALLAILDRAGLPGSRVVLAGHSIGAWSSMVTLIETPGIAAGLIGLSPACCGPVERRAVRPAAAAMWAQDARTMASAPRIEALVWLAEGDPYNPLADLAFLGRVPGVAFHPMRQAALVGMGCEADADPHLVLLEPCFAAAAGPALRAFLAAHLH